MKSIPIYDDPLIGKGILCQLGNPEDIEWCRQAEAIALSASMSAGRMHYTCVAKKANGVLLILFGVELRDDETGFCDRAHGLDSPHFNAIPNAAQIRANVGIHHAAITGNLFPFEWERRIAA
jgi:hypothetical protein